MPAINTLVGDGAPDFYGYSDASATAAHMGDPTYDEMATGSLSGIAAATNIHLAGLVLIGLAALILFHRSGFRGISV